MKWACGVACCALVLALPVVSAGQSCPEGGDRPVYGAPPIGASPSSTSFYYEAAGTLLEADGQEGFVVVDLGSLGPVRFPLDAKLRIQADKRTRLTAIKDPGLGDLLAGDRVHVKFSSWDGRIVRLKLKQPPR